MVLDLIFLIAALVFFAAVIFGVVEIRRINLLGAGLFFLTLLMSINLLQRAF